MKLKIGLADDWRKLHQRGTVIFSATCGAISAFGPELRTAWQGMPDDLKAVIPHNVQQAIAYAILFSTIIAIRYTTIRRVSSAQDGSDGSN